MSELLRVVIIAACLSVGPLTQDVIGQERLADFSNRPILVFDTGGHHAPVRRLIFTPDESKLLSAGEDKVVRVWDLTGSTPKLDWTIRPPIWRGPRGIIYGMALTTDREGRQTLALGGYGVDAMLGEIGIYRFPGAADRRQGDIDAYLPVGDGQTTLLNSKGHKNVVTCLAFSPDGSILASASNDGTVRLWDYRNKVQLALLIRRPIPGPPNKIPTVKALAFTPDGQFLASGGSDGALRIWNVANRTLVSEALPFIRPGREKNVEDYNINSLAISIDGQWVVIGREDGYLLRYDLQAADLAGSIKGFTTGSQQGPVEAIAFGPNNQLVTSIVSQRIIEVRTMADRPKVSCDIEFHNVRNPVDNPLPIAKTNNLVYALAFSPKGSYLAYSGGDQQELMLADLRVAGRPTLNISTSVTKGMSTWQVGFAGDNSIAYSFEQPSAQPPSAYYGFDLKERSQTAFRASQVQGSIPNYPGWNVTPIDPWHIKVSRGNWEFTITLDTELQGRWWNYSFLPPGPKHNKPAIAVACVGGVVIYTLEDGKQTRWLDGHEGAVYCLAPSPDGKWLATGSSDQCIRLWPLADMDVLAPLGAEFEINQQGFISVKSVANDGFAEYSGMQKGDVVVKAALDGKEVRSAGEIQRGVQGIRAEEFLIQYQQLSPGKQIAYSTNRTKADGVLEEVKFGTTKRDRPSLSLFVGLDREYVLWTPRGFYDSSVIGDSKFLGWQVNRYSKANPSPTDFYPMLTYEKELRQPKGKPWINDGDPPPPPPPPPVIPPVLKPVLGAGSPPLQGQDGKAIAVGDALPQLISMAPGQLSLDCMIELDNQKQLGRFEVRREGEILPKIDLPRLDPNVNKTTIPIKIDLKEPGKYTINLMAANAGDGVQGDLSFTAEVVGRPLKKKGQLRILSIVPDFIDNKIPPIKASQRDADDLARFFKDHFVMESGEPFQVPTPTQLKGNGAKRDQVIDALRQLGSEPLNPGDLAIVLLETHVLYKWNGNAKETMIMVSDSQGLPLSKDSMIAAEEFNQALYRLADRGCKVVLVIDGKHETPNWGFNSDVQEWARLLRRDGIISVLATTGKPIDRHVGTNQNRPLAEAILRSIEWVNPRANDRLMTLSNFGDAILEKIQLSTQREGYPKIYVPPMLERPFPILNQDVNNP